MATKTSMSVKTFLEVAPRLPVDISVLLRGKHGIGKSRLVAKIARQHKLPLIDRRLAQMSEGDVIGLPSTDGNVTRFCPPDWFMKACEEPCVLFLDELNRALPEVMQAAFQIVLDRELNGHKLHSGTRVFSAINAGSEYTVNEMDPALLRRFWTIDLEPTKEDWTAWARGKEPEDGNLDYITVDFIDSNEKWLDPPKGGDLTQVHPTRHSWERLDTSLKHFNAQLGGKADEILDANNELFYAICTGFVGVEAAMAFKDYAKNIDRQVSGEDILDNYTDKKVRENVLKLGQEKWNICIEKLNEEMDKRDKITTNNEKNVEEFMKDLPGELRVSLWSKLTAQGTKKIDLYKGTWKRCQTHILAVLGAKTKQQEAVKEETPPAAFAGVRIPLNNSLRMMITVVILGKPDTVLVHHALYFIMYILDLLKRHLPLSKAWLIRHDEQYVAVLLQLPKSRYHPRINFCFIHAMGRFIFAS